jgi:hypothetical protein
VFEREHVLDHFQSIEDFNLRLQYDKFVMITLKCRTKLNQVNEFSLRLWCFVLAVQFAVLSVQRQPLLRTDNTNPELSHEEAPDAQPMTWRASARVGCYACARAVQWVAREGRQEPWRGLTRVGR